MMIPIIILITLKISPSSALLSPEVQLHTTDIKTLILNDVFIDKSYLIGDFEVLEDFDPPDLKTILAPSGWGKTTNINMFERFFEIEVNDQGIPLPQNQTTNDKIFLGGEFQIEPNLTKKLEPLQISQNSEFIQHLGKYPVITLSLKNTTGHTYEEIEEQIKSCLKKTYQKHEYLLYSPNITEEDKNKLQNYIGGQFNAKDLPYTLGYLSEKLFQHFGQYVIILIDDFDIPVINSYLKFGKFSNESIEFNKISELIRKIITFPVRAPLDLRCVYLAVITGVFKAIELYTSPNQILSSAIPVLLYQTASYGFSPKEVRGLLTKFSTKIQPQQVKDWYGGYFYNDTIFLNPRSIMQCIARNGTIENYFIPGGYVIDEFIDEILLSDDVQQEIHFWISDKSKTYKRLIDYNRLDDVIWEDFKKSRILFHGGYYFTTTTQLGFYLSKPNKEIIQYLETKTLQWVTDKFNVSVPEFYTLVGLLNEGNFKEFQGLLQKYISNAVDYLQTEINAANAFHYGFMIAVNHTLSSNNTVTAEGKNYETHVIVPKLSQNADIAVILKYGIFEAGINITSMVKKDLEDLNNRYEGDKFKAQYSHIETVLKIAMAFSGEKFAVEYDEA